jgi:hypothetical protein
MRKNLFPCSLLLCFLLGAILAGCKSVATTFHRMHNELTSELIKDEADEDSHYYGAWFTWSASFNSEAVVGTVWGNGPANKLPGSALESLSWNVMVDEHRNSLDSVIR